MGPCRHLRSRWLKDAWIFKGGTCLKKCFFETYRFSGDLDFTLRDPGHLEAGFLKRVFREISQWVYDAVGLELPLELQAFDIYENPRGSQSCPSLAQLAPYRSDLQGSWENMLGHQLPALPPLDAFWDALPGFFDWLVGGVAIARPAAYSMADGETVIRDRALRLPVSTSAHTALEVIRFAAANRLCVDLGYQGSKRRIEPYSLRRASEDNILLHAWNVDKHAHRSYRVDRIQSAQVTNQTFVPRYQVELTPEGPVRIAATSRRGADSGNLSRAGRGPRPPTRSRRSLGLKYV